MRRLVAAIMVLVFLSVPAGAANAALVGYWSFDNVTGDQVFDDSGSGIAADGTLINGAAIVAGKVGDALSLDKDLSQYVDLGNPAKLDFYAGDFTLAAWINTTDTDSEPPSIVSKGGNNNSDANPGIRYYFSLGEGADRQELGLSLDDDIEKENTAGSTDVVDGTWHHVAAVRQGTDVTLYVDGEVDGTGTIVALKNLDTSDFNAYIGVIDDAEADPVGPQLDRSFDGLIDEVRIYDNALDETGILELLGYTTLTWPRTPISRTRLWLASTARCTA